MTDPTQQGPGEQPGPYQSQPGQPYSGQPGQPYSGQPGQPGQQYPGQPYAAPAGAPLSPADDRQWASFAHLGGIIGILPSLIIWLIFKDRGPLTNQEGKEALNFQITAVIGYVISGILAFFIVGAILGLAVWVVSIIWSIMGFARVNAGGTWRYPITIRFIK